MVSFQAAQAALWVRRSGLSLQMVQERRCGGVVRQGGGQFKPAGLLGRRPRPPAQLGPRGVAAGQWLRGRLAPVVAHVGGAEDELRLRLAQLARRADRVEHDAVVRVERAVDVAHVVAQVEDDEVRAPPLRRPPRGARPAQLARHLLVAQDLDDAPAAAQPRHAQRAALAAEAARAAPLLAPHLRGGLVRRGVAVVEKRGHLRRGGARTRDQKRGAGAGGRGCICGRAVPAAARQTASPSMKTSE